MKENEYDFDDEIIELSSDNDDEKTVEINKLENVIDGLEKRVFLDNQEKEEEVKEENENILAQNRETKYHKKTLKEKWEDLDKSKKIMIILIPIILIILIGVIVYFVFFKKPKEEDKPVKEPVVIEKDNYKYVDGKLVFLNRNEQEIGEYECSNKSDTLCLVKKVDNASDSFDRVIDVDATGNEIIKNTPIYFDKYVFITDGENTFLYDFKNKEKLVDVKSVKVYNKDDNLAIIEDTNNRFGLIKLTESEFTYLIRASYDYLGMINSDLQYLLAKDDKNTYIIDSTGKKLSSNIKDNIMSVNKEFVTAKSGNSYKLYDYDYNELLTDYDYISLHDGVVACVKSNRLYLFDNNLNKLSEEGIRLQSLTNFVAVNVYENNKLKEVKVAYTISVKDNKVYVTIENDTKEVNMLEGIISSNYGLMSYFDGRLYFYNDEDKKDIMGSYTCTNKNTLNSTKDNLNNCYVYKIDDKLSGVYNGEFVFIYDNLSNSSNNIYLYDLKTNKVRSTYSDIKVLKTSELSDEVKNIYTSSSYFIAKSATGSNSGNYGVLEITSDGVKGKIDFKYKEIKAENNYYSFKNTNNEYSIYNKDFEKISNDFAYLELYDKYYAGVNDGKLNIYKYDNALGILEETIDVPNNEFKIEFDSGYKITVGDKEYFYDLDGKLTTNNPSTDNEGTGEDGE